MRSYLIIPFWVVCAGFVALACAVPATAQCGANSTGFGNVGLVAGNPFHAEVTLTTAGSGETSGALRPNYPQWVARDSQGRVRTDRVAGKFKRDTGPEAGTTVELHEIVICDPVAQTLTQIDTASATAKIFHSRTSSTGTPAASQRSFCFSRLLLNHPGGHTQVDDLGYQTIEGIVAHGARITTPMLGTTAGNEPPNGESTAERWCSDELAAVILTVVGSTKTGVKFTTAMRNIERTEPDPTLFQIPPDYAVTEAVAEPQ